MPDSTQSSDAHGERHDRNAKIEELLLAGLDYYFAGEHERAISVWTRVLFLDRGHVRARAYIERARGALAERQRESEELVHRGAAAFEEGRAADARELLSAAVARGGPHEIAVALLDRLDRLEAFPSPDGARAAARGPRGASARTPRGLHRGASLLIAVSILALVAAIVYLGSTSFPGAPLVPTPARANGRAAGAAAPIDVLPLPRSAELALARARTDAAAGHLKDALVELDQIGPGDPAHPEAQRLRADIQASLIAGLPLRATDRRTK